MVIILQVTVLASGDEVGGKIGEPVNFQAGAPAPVAPAAGGGGGEPRMAAPSAKIQGREVSLCGGVTFFSLMKLTCLGVQSCLWKTRNKNVKSTINMMCSTYVFHFKV